MSIPKKIHYVWIGGNPKPDVVLKCIESWKRFFPDFEIIEWNENNYDINKSKYLKDAYQAKKWAFASDYMRFDILNNEGGIYVDTDVEFLKNLPEEYLEKRAFTGTEKQGLVNPGLVFACEKGYWLAEEMVRMYDKQTFNQNQLITVNYFTSSLLEKYGFIKNDEYQIIKDLEIYPSDVFCGYDTEVMEYAITDDTISVHHCIGTWTKNSTKRKIQRILKRIIGIERYRQLLGKIRIVRNMRRRNKV